MISFTVNTDLVASCDLWEEGWGVGPIPAVGIEPGPPS